MLRGNRRVIIAAFVGLVAAAPAQSRDNRTEPQQAQSARETDKAAGQISAAILKTIQPTEGKGRCASGKYEDDADLCAQWESADAARDAAKYAFWSMWIAAAGAALLIGTFGISLSTSHRQLRAYLDFGKMKFSRSPNPVGRVSSQLWIAKIPVVNFGETPAYNVTFKSRSHIPIQDNFGGAEWRDNKDTLGGISGGDRYNYILEVDIINDDISRIHTGELNLWFDLTVKYRDAFRRLHTTSIVVEVKRDFSLFKREGSHKMN